MSHHTWLGLSFKVLRHCCLLFALSVADLGSWSSSKDRLLGFEAAQEFSLSEAVFIKNEMYSTDPEKAREFTRRDFT